jgi:hypothetical protein
MGEDLNINNKGKEISAGENLQDVNNNPEKPEDNLSGPIEEYNNILKRREKSASFFGNFSEIAICILIFLLVFLNVYLVETEKYAQNILKIQQQQLARQKQEEMDKAKLLISEKNKQAADLVIFNDKYVLTRKNFYNNIRAISLNAENKFNSLEDIIKITEDRIKLTEDYKSKLSSLAIPAQLADFYKFEIEFADSDITLWKIIDAYYKLSDLSAYDTSRIYDESSKSHELFLRAQEELKNVYTKYGLNYFIKDIIIDY